MGMTVKDQITPNTPRENGEGKTTFPFLYRHIKVKVKVVRREGEKQLRINPHDPLNGK